MKCYKCRGACCETFSLPLTDLRPPGADARRWVMLHGQTIDDGVLRVEFECACTVLSENGSCSIYSDRPQVCRDMTVGGDECLHLVRTRRSPSQYAVIREEIDPLTIHDEDQE